MPRDETVKEKIQREFIAYCYTGNIKELKKLYEKYPPNHSHENWLVSSFISISNFGKPSLDLHYDDDKGFKIACQHGHIDMVRFFLNNKRYVSEINKNNQISVGLADAVLTGHIDIAKLIFPYITNKNENYFNSIYLGFISACIDGKLEAVRYFLNQNEVHIKSQDLIFHQLPLLNSSRLLCLLEACQAGHIDIVKYLTTSPELNYHADINSINEEVRINSIDLMQYFIFELNIQKDSPCMKFLKFTDKKAVQDLFEKRDNFAELKSKLDDNSVTKPSVRKSKI